MRYLNLGLAFAKSHWKYGVAVIGAGLWLTGLVDQIESMEMTARYLGISLAMAAVAAVTV